MKRIFLFAFFLIFIKTSVAQDTRIKLNTIRDSAALGVLAYAYPEFTAGQVVFKNNSTSAAKLNYDRYKDEILFLGPTNTLMVLDNLETVDKIVIGSDTYYPQSPGYAKYLGTFSHIDLLKKTNIKFIGREKKGAYGTYSATSAASSSALGAGEGIIGLTTGKSGGRVDENLVFALTESFYFSSPSKKVVVANAKELLRLNPNYAQEIKKYLSDEKINFHKQKDIQQVLTYTASLK